MTFTRRAFLANAGAGILAVNLPLWATGAFAQNTRQNASDTTPGLNPPDSNGLMLRDKFQSRVLGRSGQDILGYTWHGAPDGGATFKTEKGGWIYVSNSEMPNADGGVGAIEFDKRGNPVSAYSILSGTAKNCAGGKTPWNTWLSCEEHPEGLVWECDPSGFEKARALLALGKFKHEAAAIDPKTMQIYLTEDVPDGGFYRFTPRDFSKGNRPSLEAGMLEIAVVTGRNIDWHKLPYPESGEANPTRYQIKNSAKFNGGEGCAFRNGIVYFSTKGDNRVCAYNIAKDNLGIIYDVAMSQTPILTGVDNLEITPHKRILVAEDNGKAGGKAGSNHQLVVLERDGKTQPLLQLVGHDGSEAGSKESSEMTGPAFSPDGRHLYFSSQRGKRGLNEDGYTYVVSGPF